MFHFFAAHSLSSHFFPVFDAFFLFEQEKNSSSFRSFPAVAHPPKVALVFAEIPQQVSAEKPAFAFKGFQIRPLAQFTIRARVLSREDYDHGREADFSPVDLALGWGRMRDDAVLSKLDISQSGRFYRYRWSGPPPIPPDDIVRSSANMHIVPADARVAAALASIEAGQRVRIDGWLVRIDAGR